VEVKFANDSVFKLSAEFLRINNLAVDGKIKSIGCEKVISGRSQWEFICITRSNKFTLMRNYIKTLKKYELRRDPRGENDATKSSFVNGKNRLEDQPQLLIVHDCFPQYSCRRQKRVEKLYGWNHRKERVQK
ncbi:hypothetical protein RYX36_020447, partial [Vicia faba]